MRKPIVWLTMPARVFTQYWNQGKPLAWIAAEGGVHYSTISKRAKTLGLKPRHTVTRRVSEPRMCDRCDRNKASHFESGNEGLYVYRYDLCCDCVNCEENCPAQPSESPASHSENLSAPAKQEES
jgi:hypothetical protein